MVKKQSLSTRLRYSASLKENDQHCDSPPLNLKKTTRRVWNSNRQRPQETKNHIQINIDSCSARQSRQKHQDSSNRKSDFNNEFNNVVRRISGESDKSGLMTMFIPSTSSSSTSSVNTYSSNSDSKSSNSSNSSNSSFKQQARRFSNLTEKKLTSANIQSINMMPSVTSRLKKNISRTKEKILQGMGKSDRTSDENFDLYVENFERQHTQANKLTKELNRYLSCLKETQKASKTFYDTLQETYEPTWPDQRDFGDQVNTIEDKWMNYINKLVNDVQMPLISYLNEFPELKKKIDKRDNRLLDYDNARHTLESVQYKNIKKGGTATLAFSSSNTNPLGSGASNSLSASSSTTEQLTKLTKLKIDLEDKQHVYEDINQTLCMALPVLFENRIKFYSSLFQTFFYTETIFHSDLVEIKSKLDTLCENLSTQTTKQISTAEALYYAKLNNENEVAEIADHTEALAISEINSNAQASDIHLSSQEVTLPTSEISTLNERQQSSHLPPNIGFIEASTNEINYIESLNKSDSHKQESKSKSNSGELTYDSSQLESIENFLDKSLKHLDLSPIMYKTEAVQYVNTKETTSENTEQTPSVSHMENTVASALYRVKATYSYKAKELDELTFVKEDFIDVVEGTESENEELDEGWLIGIHESSLKRGLFPANFTKKI